MKIIRFTAHAFERMFERGISPIECERAFLASKVIESYPKDKPFPSVLLLSFVEKKPIHLVVAETPDSIHIITVYIPDPSLWSADFTVRRKESETK